MELADLIPQDSQSHKRPLSVSEGEVAQPRDSVLNEVNRLTESLLGVSQGTDSEYFPKESITRNLKIQRKQQGLPRRGPDKPTKSMIVERLGVFVCLWILGESWLPMMSR